MNLLVLQILKSIAIYGALYCLLGIIFERLLIIKGVVRGNTLIVVISSVLITSLFQFISLGEGNNIFYIVLVVFVMPLKANQSDLVKTIEKGTWWWKMEENPKRK